MALVYPDDPFFNGKLPHQTRRGTLTQIQNYVAAEGEIIYSTSTQQIFVGDGVTPGGVAITGGGGGAIDYGPIIV